jgi:putative IMPACT (imprinted ancient) family translation regulator
VRRVLSELPRANKVLTHTITTVIPYAWYERVRDLVFAHKGQIIDQEFAADVTMTAKISVEVFPGFQAALIELSRGSLESEVIGTEEAIVPV